MTRDIDDMGDFYGGESGPPGEMVSALERWDYDNYLPLRSRDPELYRLICSRLGYEVEILLGQGAVKLGLAHRRITLTWTGSQEDLVDLVLEGARLIAPPS